MGLCQKALNGVQAEQADTDAIADMRVDVDALTDTGKRIVALAEEMSGLKAKAWG